MAVDRQLRSLVGRIAKLEKQMLQSRRPNLGLSSIDDGGLVLNDGNGDPAVVLGPDGVAYVDLDGPPSKTSTPTLATRLGVQIVTWDGLNYLGAAMESDLDRVEVHGQPFAFTATPGNAATILEILPPGPGFIVKAGNTYGVTWHYQLIAIDKSGLASPPSGDVSGATVALVDTDLIGQIISGAHIVNGSITASDKIIANTITGGLIQALAINAGHINANSITADKIDVGAVTAVKIAANAISADKIVANAITGDKIQANAIDGKTITGATVKTAGSGNRIELKGDGSAGSVEFYNSSGVLSGKIRSISTYLDVSGGGLTPAYLHLESANCSLHGEYLFLIPGSGGINMMGDIYAGSRTMAIGTLNGGGEVHGATLWSDSPNSTAQPTANVYMTAGGQLQIMTSTEAAKTNIRLAAIDVDAALQLEPKVYQSLCEADDPDADIFGFSAQQAQSLGLDEWVVYEADGETVQGFSYTGWVVALQATNRRQQEQIDALSDRFDALEESR